MKNSHARGTQEGAHTRRHMRVPNAYRCATWLSARKVFLPPENGNRENTDMDEVIDSACKTSMYGFGALANSLQQPASSRHMCSQLRKVPDGYDRGLHIP